MKQPRTNLASSAPGGSKFFSGESSPLALVKPQVRRAYRDLLCLMHSQDMTQGSALPPHETLRRSIRCGSNVLDEAMQLLVDDGVITRSRSLGTTVRELSRVAAHTWSIAVVAIDEPEYAVKPLAEHYLRRALLERGCADRTYLTKPSVRGKRQDLPLSDCVALAEDVESGKVDGILSLVRLRSGPVPIVHVMTAQTDAPWVTLDFGAFVKDAAGHLVLQGARKLALICGSDRATGEQGEALLAAIASEASLPKPRVIEAKPRAWEGARLAAELIAMSPSHRPSGLIVSDDHVASGLTAALCAFPEYQPQIAVLANLQLPMPMARPVTRFVLDIRELADVAVEAVLRRVLGAGSARDDEAVRMIRAKLLPIEQEHLSLSSNQVPTRRPSAGARR